MSVFLSTLLTSIPIWVFPLFIVLLVLGLRATRNRRVPLLVLYALPVLGGLGLQSILSLGPDLALWIITACAYAIGTALGMRLQKRWTLSRTSTHAEVLGEWLTLTAMMTLFIANFILGVLNATAPELAQSRAFSIPFSTVIALFSGQFLGRAITTLLIVKKVLP